MRKLIVILLFSLWASVVQSQTITSMSYSTDRGQSGSISAPFANWTSSIPLLAGLNTITITTTNSLGQIAIDQITVTYTPIHPGNALVAAYAFKDGSGTAAIDSTANSNTASLLNGAVFTSQGKFDSGITFTRASGSYVNIPDQTYNDFTQSFTISAWVKPTNLTGWQTIAAKSQTVNGMDYPVQFLYAHQSGGEGCNPGELQAGFIANGVLGPVQNICSTVPLATGSYSHVAVSYDGASLRLYINGALNKIQDASGIMEPSALAWKLGNDDYASALAGDLDEVRLYNYAIPLTAASNTTPGTACSTTNFNDNIATPSVVGNMNCQIIPGVPPSPLKFPASATGLKVGASATGLKFGQPGP